MKFASSRDNTSDPFCGARTEPVFGDCEVAVIGATSPASMLVQTPPEREQSEMPNVTFFSEVPAARGPNFDDYAETKQSNWLKERSNPSLWQASSRGLPIGRAYAFGEFSKKREQCPVHGPDFIKGAARMSRIRFSQPQGTKRRDGQTTAATVRRFCSKGDDAVRNCVDPLG